MVSVFTKHADIERFGYDYGSAVYVDGMLDFAVHHHLKQEKETLERKTHANEQGREIRCVHIE